MSKFLLLTLIIILACSMAVSADTLNSSTGYVQLPSAAITPADEIQLSAAYVRSEGKGELSKLDIALPCNGDGYNVRLLTGLNDRLELGLGYLDVRKSVGHGRAYTIAAKGKLYEDTGSGLALALGASYRNWSTDMEVSIPGDTIEIDLPAVTSVYLVLDKEFQTTGAWDVKGSLGAIYDNYSSSKQKTESGLPFFIVPGDFPISATGKVKAQSFISPFVGLQATDGDWSVKADYKPRLKKDDFYYASDVWSIAVGKVLNENMSVKAGLTNFNLPYSDSDTAFFVDFSYAFAKK